MGWSVFTQADGVVSGDPDDWVAGQGRESEGARGIGDKVQEGTTVSLEVCTIGGNTIHDGTHGVFTDTVTNVSAGVGADAEGWRLEVNSVGPSGQVGRSQVCRTTNEFWQVLFEFAEDNLGHLSGGHGLVLWGVDREQLFPVFRQFFGQSSGDLCALFGVLLAVRFKQQVPFLVCLFALVGNESPVVVDFRWDVKELLWVKAKLLLQLDNVVWLQWGAVDGGAACIQRAETDGGGDLDTGWLVGGGLCLFDGLGNGLVVCVCIRDLEDLPAVGGQSCSNVFGEGQSGGTVDGDLVVVVEGNQVAQLQVAGQGAGLGGDTFHHTSITKEGVGVVVGDLVVWLVVLCSKVCLGNGHSDGVGDPLPQRTRGDVDARGAGLWVTWGLGVELSELLEVLNGDWVAHKVEHHVQEGDRVPIGKNKAVSVHPLAVLRVGLHLGKQNVGSGSHAHWGARMARVGLGDGVCCEDSDGVDCLGGEVGHDGWVV